MPIRVLQEGAYEVPVVICDHCGKAIETARDGSYRWRLDVLSDYPGAPVYYTHRRCSRKFERANKGDWGSMDLDCLPVYLGHNLQLDWRSAASKACRSAGVDV